jgi:hypothetical protein
MLQRLRERAPGYDRENRFFQEDFDELRQAGYLAIAVPRELGGGALSFADCNARRRTRGRYFLRAFGADAGIPIDPRRPVILSSLAAFSPMIFALSASLRKAEPPTNPRGSYDPMS